MQTMVDGGVHKFAAVNLTAFWGQPRAVWIWHYPAINPPPPLGCVWCQWGPGGACCLGGLSSDILFTWSRCLPPCSRKKK